MRKIGICAAVLALVNILCCCSAAKDVLLKTGGYSGVCVIRYGDIAYTADIFADEVGEFTLEISEPQDLKGLKVSLGGEGMILSYAGMQWMGGSGDLPQAAVAAAIRNVFSSASGQGVQPSETSDGCFVLQGGSASGDYRFIFDENGMPKKLTIPSLDLEVEFSATDQ